MVYTVIYKPWTNSRRYPYLCKYDGTNWHTFDFDLDNTEDQPPCMEVVIDPKNGNRIWACFAGFDSDKRVKVSVDGASSWQNYSDGLPELPVNCMEFDEYNRTLYVATDIGIYKRDEGSAAWTLLEGDFPKTIVSDMKINRTTGELIVSTYGRGCWITQLDWGYTTGLVEINNSVTYENEMHFYTDIKVVSGGYLTITEDLTMNLNAEIVVENGGRLFIKSADIKSTTGNLWNGIIIKNGGNLIIENTTINDYSIVVEYGGDIDIRDGITISGLGDMLIDGEIKMKNNSTINLVGKNNNIYLCDGAEFFLFFSAYDDSFNVAGGSLGKVVKNTDHLDLSTPITSDKNEFGGIITVNTTISGYSMVNLTGVESVTLDKGFELQKGSILETNMKKCP